MPELPEVEVIARGLNASLVGRKIVSVAYSDLTRLSEPAETLLPKLPGRIIHRVSRRAKVLLVELSADLILAIHLKMTGRAMHSGVRHPDKHDRLLLQLDDGSLFSFADMRKFGLIRSFTAAELDTWDFLVRCGPEPLETDAEHLAARLLLRRTAIKAALLNQTVLVGVGNIYADESLFRAGIHPETKASSLSKKEAIILCQELQAVLLQAIRENGSSIRNYVNADGDAGAFQNSFRVYGKKGDACFSCGATLQTVKVTGRTSTFCPQCQVKRKS